MQHVDLQVFQTYIALMVMVIGEISNALGIYSFHKISINVNSSPKIKSYHKQIILQPFLLHFYI